MKDIFDEQLYKTEFWKDKNFYGLDMTCLQA